MSRKVLLVSTCLLGINTKYNGGNNHHPHVVVLQKKALLVPCCPEQLGGLSTPRAATEIRGGDGHNVLAGCARVVTATNEDRTNAFIAGAEAALCIAEVVAAEGALLKARSPSCGRGCIYGGHFNETTKKGDGVTAALLTRAGLPIFTEEELPELMLWLTNRDS
ncbi:MAG: DUF523 domain-containing protein [Firmicutes bacterium]|nr:DUF523 domain-containing protein [Bacillota bacterium]